LPPPCRWWERSPSSWDGGSRAFPITLGCVLVFGAAYEFFKSRVRGKKETALGREVADEPGVGDFLVASKDESAKPGTPMRVRLLSVCVGLVAYLLLLPVVGFIIATTVFACLMMRWLATTWPMSMLSALILTVAVYGLFVRLFKVLLPDGILFH